MKVLYFSLLLLFGLPGFTFSQETSPFPPGKGLVSDAALESFRNEIKGYVDDDTIVGGELLIIKNRKTVMHEAFGLQDKEDKKPLKPGSIFNIRSMTKTLTGAALQMLIDEGKLHPDDPAAKFLPSFDNDKSRGITVRHLLEHRSGLPLTTITTSLKQYPNLQAQVQAAGETGPTFTPGEKFFYSDAGTDAVAAIVEKVTGKSIDLFVTERLLQPLGMVDSFYVDTPDKTRKDRIVSLYIGKPGTWTRFWKPGPEPMYPFAWGSQSLYGTTVDYAKFLAFWLDGGKVNGKQLLSEAAVKRILTPESVMLSLGSNSAEMPTCFPGWRGFYGQMSVLHGTRDTPKNTKVKVIGHSGSDGTIGWAFPEQDLIICYFTQSRGQATPIRLESTIYRQFLANAQNEKPIPESWKPYLGTYYANFGPYKNAKFKILYQGGRLALDIPDQLILELKEPDKDDRWATVLNERMSIAFNKDGTGKVVSITVKRPNQSYELPTEPVK